MSERKAHIPPVYKRLLSLRWYRPAVDSEATETLRQRNNSKHGNLYNHNQEQYYADRNNGGLTKEQTNFLVFRAGKETPEGIFRASEDGTFFPDIAPRVEHFMDEDIRQIRCMLSRGYSSYEVDKPSVWKILYFAELLLKGYTLRRLVSKGDFGVVYSATCNGANCKPRVAEEIAQDGATKVGIKVIDKSDTHWYQVRNEIAAHASASQHPNVLKLYQVFHTATAIYIVQEYSSVGGSLTSIVPRNGFTEHDCRHLLKEILHGLRHLQRLDIVHRNLTCTNILLNSHGRVKIAEFGLACVLPDRDYLLHQKVGTSGYMAPEILRGLRYNGFLSDIWSIGIVLYFLLHKFLPFADEDLNPFNCWHCLDFTHRSLSVDVCLLLRSILQSRPTARPSVESILRHDWMAVKDVAKPIVVKSQAYNITQVKDSSPPLRPSVQTEGMKDRLTDAHRSTSDQSVQEREKEVEKEKEKQREKELLNQKKDVGPCWANLMCSNGQQNESITLKSRLISQTQQEKINRLDSKLKAMNKAQRKTAKPSSSLKAAVLPELSGTQWKKRKQPSVGGGESGGGAGPPTQVPSAPTLPTPVTNEPTPIDTAPLLEPDPAGEDGGQPGKKVYCNSLRCLKEIQTQRMLFETPSYVSHRSSLTIKVPSVSEDDEANYDTDEGMKTKDKEARTKKLDKDDETHAAQQSDDSMKTIDEDGSGMAKQSAAARTGPTIETRQSTDEVAAQSEASIADDRRSRASTEPSHMKSKELVASAHQMKEMNSEKRLISSIRSLRDSMTTNIESISSIRTSINDEFDTPSWMRYSGIGMHVGRASLDALDEVPAEYAAGVDVEDEAIERFIKTQYYNQLDLPSAADDPLEAELNDTVVGDGISSRSKTTTTVDGGGGSPDSDDIRRATAAAATTTMPSMTPYDVLGNWIRAVRSGSMASDSSSSVFHPELAINWDAVNLRPDLADVVQQQQREIRTKSRTTVVSRAPSLRAITEEHHARAVGVGGSGSGSESLPEKILTQENLRKADTTFRKRTSENFPTSSVGRLQTQSNIQVQEERGESAVWESISARGIPRGSYPKLAASVACETSLHSIVELNTEKELEHDN